ncbi:MAG: adenylate kinase [Chloroflexota bacterium]|nr:adenylate kinase [Chloroflexota bacterium]
MNIILMGAQGSGKGTQAAMLSPRLKLVKIATGDLFRTAIAAGSPLGKQVEAILDAGDLVPDDLTNAIVRERLEDIARVRAGGEDIAGALFDGFPRTEAQARALDEMLARHNDAITVVIEIVVPFAVLVERLSGRRVCSVCGTIYHATENPPDEDGVCDRCGGAVVQREDDKPEPIRRRLALYEAQTTPLLEYYRERGLLDQIDGNLPVEQVTDALIETIDRRLVAAAH